MALPESTLPCASRAVAVSVSAAPMSTAPAGGLMDTDATAAGPGCCGLPGFGEGAVAVSPPPQAATIIAASNRATEFLKFGRDCIAHVLVKRGRSPCGGDCVV